MWTHRSLDESGERDSSAFLRRFHLRCWKRVVSLASVINTSLNPIFGANICSPKMQISRISKLSEGRTVAFMEGK